jgi:ATP-dependent DNA helicase RecG
LQKEVSVFTFNDLLQYYPFRYIDRSKMHRIRDVFEGAQEVQLQGTLLSIEEVGAAKKKRLVVVFKDDTGTIELLWFKGTKWIKSSLSIGKEYLVYGRVNRYGNKFSIPHPEIEEVINSKQIEGYLQPIYHSGDKLSARGLSSRGFEKILHNLISQLNGTIVEVLSKEICANYTLIGKEEALKQIHFPNSLEKANKASFRLKFEELFFLQLQMIKQKQVAQKKTQGFVFSKVRAHFNTFFNDYLPFELTGAQKRVMKEIRKDMGSGLHMNRMLQGDVGSGKTLVALLSVLIALDNGFQTCLMAPTEILATQHYNSIKEFVGEMGVEVALLTGSVKTAQRKIIHSKLEDGSLDILIGTHALIEDKVKFKNIGLAVIDEQHRFGVAQRSKLWRKNLQPPHILLMTATPIPRTLAMTFYGDLDVSVIDELPPGRKPIETRHYFDQNRLKVFQFIEDEIAKGRQVYIVYPLIEESEKMDYKDLMDGYESISRRFPVPKYQVSIVHGRMKAADKEYEMSQFAAGKTQIMVATTVIEVGVNVPNASVMIVESAEKFGLSQLHQLRGRVGRGGEQSYCLLMTSFKLSVEAKKRIGTLVRTNDGFEIAEVDLKMRGPGDIMGTQQSGLLDLKIADLARDGQIVQLARDAAMEVLKDDPDLMHKKNYEMRMQLFLQIKNRPDWSRIS